jgi:hypothetical protein
LATICNWRTFDSEPPQEKQKEISWYLFGFGDDEINLEEDSSETLERTEETCRESFSEMFNDMNADTPVE